MSLVYSDDNQIRSVSGDLKESKLLFSSPGVQVSDFDIDVRRNLIYWTSGNTNIFFELYILFGTHLLYNKYVNKKK